MLAEGRVCSDSYLTELAELKEGSLVSEGCGYGCAHFSNIVYLSKLLKKHSYEFELKLHGQPLH